MNKHPKRMNNRKRALPPLEQMLHEAQRIYKYDTNNGGLVWKAYAHPGHPGMSKIGASVGGDDGHGYKMCMLLGHKFKVHQIVWLLHHRELPSLPLDHINRDKRDNRIENLRLAMDQQNSVNRNDMTHKYTGVTKDSRGHGYAARIGHRGKKIYLGYFKTKEEARDAYIIASRQIRGGFSAV